MKKILLLSTLLFLVEVAGVAQSVVGKWKTIDDATKKPKSIVELYEVKGQLFGKIVKLLDKPQTAICEGCKGKEQGKPLVGLTIIEGLKRNWDVWNGGTILDPQNGKRYKCFITLIDKDKLKVRGYIGMSLLGRTQYWYRVEE